MTQIEALALVIASAAGLWVVARLLGEVLAKIAHLQDRRDGHGR